MMDQFHVVGIFLGADLVLSLGFSLFAGKLIDKDGNGRIDLNELPKWSQNIQKPVDGGGYYDFGVMSGVQTLTEAFAFAVTYGAITVFTCNAFLPDRLDDEVGWLACMWLVMLALIYMCAFSTNGIHIITSHVVHFIYYGCGFIPLCWYRRLPEQAWLVAAVVIFRLLVHTGVKYYVWPKYPTHFEIVPLYTRDEQGELTLFCTPDDQKEKTKGMPLFEQLQLLIPYPNYEVMNTHITSCMCYGMIIGAICSGFISDPIRKLLISVLVAALISLCFVLLPCLYCEGTTEPGYGGGKWKALSRFFPKVLAIVGFIGGAACSVTHTSLSAEHKKQLGLAMVGVTHGSHFLGLLLFVLSYLAVIKHFGCAVCKRMGSFGLGGDGGMHFETPVEEEEEEEEEGEEEEHST